MDLHRQTGAGVGLLSTLKRRTSTSSRSAGRCRPIYHTVGHLVTVGHTVTVGYPVTVVGEWVLVHTCGGSLRDSSISDSFEVPHFNSRRELQRQNSP